MFKRYAWNMDWTRHAYVLYELQPDEGAQPKEVLAVDVSAAQDLVKFMNDYGHLRPTIDTKVRDEDVKMMNRLMDIIEKKVPGGA